METAEPPTEEHEPAQAKQAELLGGLCKTAADCSAPILPCRTCSDGSQACPQVTCSALHLCSYSFATCNTQPPPPPPPPPPTDACKNVVCASGTHCVGGDCVIDDPCTGVTCNPGSHCEAGSCQPDDLCQTVKCASGTHCDAGICTPDSSTKKTCGGIAAFPCPGSGMCVDDPTDSCNPWFGGADCGGICICAPFGFCKLGTHWDASPGVCACVP
jgi:hypothetical protein